MQINIEEYLTEEDMRRIAQEEFRAVCSRSSLENFERILNNAAYDLVRKEVDLSFDGGMERTVKEKAVKIINELSAYSVFKAPNAWDKQASKGWTYLQRAIDNAEQAINDRVISYVRNMPEDELRELIADRFAEAMISKLADCKGK